MRAAPSSVIALCLLLQACGDAATPAASAADAGTNGDASDGGATPSCLAPIEAPAWLDGYLADNVAKLSGAADIAPGGRLTDRGTPEQRLLARVYLRDQLASLGLDTATDDYGEGANVVARLAATAGSATDWIVVGAHFDSEIGSPGANDNASGVAAVLAVARALKDVPCRSHGVMFVMFDQEEIGLVGSKAFAKRERAAGTAIVAAHTVDQVGWDADDDRVFEIELPTAPLFAEYQAGAAVVGAKVVQTKTSGTDHSSLRAQGYPAVGVTEEYVAGDTSPHRHLPGDQAATVKASYLSLAARLVTYVVARELGAE